MAIADADGGLDQLAGIEIEDRLRLGLVAGAGIIARQDQQIANSQCSRPQ